MAFCTNCGQNIEPGNSYCRGCEKFQSQSPRTTQPPRVVVEKGWTWKRWLPAGGAIVVVLVIIGIAVGGSDSEDAPEVVTGDFIEFGIGPNNESDDLLLAGVGSDFNQETQIWLRMQLSKEFGDSTLQFFCRTPS